jgi:hypothetical protein
MNTLQLYASASATASAVAQVVIPSRTKIKGIQYAISLVCKTDAVTVDLELSKIPTSQISVNGAKDPFFHFAAASNFVTSGLSQPSFCYFIPLDVDCRQGEIIYLHAYLTGTATFRFHGLLYYP